MMSMTPPLSSLAALGMTEVSVIHSYPCHPERSEGPFV